MCAALTAFHAYTGSDYNAAFNRKGKKRPLQTLLKDKEAMKAFAELGKHELVPVPTCRTLERFTCSLYGMKSSSVNQTRYKLLIAKLPKRGLNCLKKLKTLDPASLPPCKSCLEQKLKRANFISHVWRNAHQQSITPWQPEQHGWKLKDGRLSPVWFEGSQLPDDLYYEPDGTVSDDNDTDDETDDELESEVEDDCLDEDDSDG